MTTSQISMISDDRESAVLVDPNVIYVAEPIEGQRYVVVPQPPAPPKK